MGEATQKDWWADDDGCIAAGHGEEYETLAKVLPGPHKDLMIAAPDLLAACKAAIRGEDWREILTLAKDAVAKAEGK